jgi:gas vesicle protein
MIGADKAGVKKSRKTLFKGVLIGVLAGMAAWLVIAVLVAKK